MKSIRKTYIMRLIFRSIVFVLSVILVILRPEELDLLQGTHFFSRFSILHLLWGVWILDMVVQLVPVKFMPLGSQKLFQQRFRSEQKEIDEQGLRQYIATTTKAAYKIFLLWVILLVVLGALYYNHVLDDAILFLVSVAFYVCDLICVLIWCPFRVYLKNQCCTTCRIFNWDHLMMFTPMVFIKGFYSWSLVILSFVVWGLWEWSVWAHPERFWEDSNEALRCSQCTDKLCTQRCQKPRL